jgi:hypothetical protein
MKNELDPKIAWGAIGLIMVLVALGYYFFFRTPSGVISAKEAGAGDPVRPGEIPAEIPPPPWANQNGVSSAPQTR